MKIKANKNPFIPRKFRDAFRRRKRLAGGMLGLSVIVGSVVLFFTIFKYGGYLYQSGQTQHFKQMLSDMVSFDFSFVGNYFKGQATVLDDVKIDMKFKHMLRIQYLREQAVKSKYIDDVYKEEEFPAKLTFNGQTHDVKINLTGKVARTHLGNPSKWSFEVKVKGDDTIDGMKRFGMLVPTARGNLTDWLSFELLQELGLMGLRIDYVDVSINGKPYGVFYMEERFDKYLIENNRLREGIIYKLDKDIFPIRESKLLEDPTTRAQVMLLKRMWQDVMSGDLPAEKFFDMEKMAKVFVVSDLMNNRHPLSRDNLRFYFNPVTGLSEPIAREFEDVSKSDPTTMNMFLEKPNIYTREFWLSQEKIIGLIHQNREFQRHYIQEAEKASQKKFLEEFFAQRKDKLDEITGKVYRTWPFYKLPSDILYGHQQHIRSMLFPNQPQLTARYQEKDGDYLSIHLQNQQDLPLEVAYVSWKDMKYYPEKPVILDSEIRSDIQGGQVHRFLLPEETSWSEDKLAELKVYYNLLGLETGTQSVSLTIEPELLPTDEIVFELSEKANYASFDFIKEEQEGKVLSIPAGNWKISKDLIIPQGKRLQVEPGAKIDIVNHAKWISYSPVYFRGTEGNPIQLLSSDATGEGLIVIRAPQRSHLSFTTISGLSHPQKEYGIDGAITFYESSVNIVSCDFSTNQMDGAMLHLIKSDYLIEQSAFRQIKGSAVKSRFSTGIIQQTTFNGTTGNGVVISASELEMSNIFMKEIGGSALWVVEASRLNGQWVDIRNAGAGIVGQDRSEVDFHDIQILNSRIGAALYQEKMTYGPAWATFRNINMQQVEIPYLVEESARMIVDGKTQGITQTSDKVKQILDGEALEQTVQ